MAVLAPLVLLSLPVVRVAAGGSAFAALSAAVGAASERWLWPTADRVRFPSYARRARRAGARRPVGNRAHANAARLTGERWALSAVARQADIDACDAFLAAAERWPRHVWLAIGRAVGPHEPQDAAVGALETLAATPAHRFAAWLVRDAVETAAAMAVDTAGPVSRGWRTNPPSPEAQAIIRRACRVVERAALARLLRAELSADDYTALRAPAAVLQLAGARPAHRRPQSRP